MSAVLELLPLLLNGDCWTEMRMLENRIGSGKTRLRRTNQKFTGQKLSGKRNALKGLKSSRKLIIRIDE